MKIVSLIIYLIVVSSFILAASLALYRFAKDKRRGAPLSSVVFSLICILSSVFDLISSNSPFVTADIALSMLPLLTLPTFATGSDVKAVIASGSAIALMRMTVSVLSLWSVEVLNPERLFAAYYECIMILYILSFLVCIGRFVFGHCSNEDDFTLWMSASIYVDGAYVSVAVLLLSLARHIDLPLVHAVISLLLAVMFILSVYRVSKGTLFALLRKSESRFKDRLKNASSGNAGEDSIKSPVYKELFGRIEAYFAEHRPYLDPNITIGDLAKALYTNKVYISRAVGIYRGLNFCQYINEYRIRFAKAVLVKNPTARIGAVALYSGFNSVVSFNSAFKLFEGVSPGQWARRHTAENCREPVIEFECLSNPYLPADFHI